MIAEVITPGRYKLETRDGKPAHDGKEVGDSELRDAASFSGA